MIVATCETPSMGLMLRVGTVLPLMVAGLVMGCSMPLGPDVAAEFGERNPADVVTQNYVTLRSDSPAELGDADLSTDIRDALGAGGGGLSGTSRLVADSLEPYEVPNPEAVLDSIRIYVAAGIIPSALLEHYSNARIVWTLDVTEDEEAVAMFPVMSTENPTIGGDNFPVDLFIRSTDFLTEKPGGGAWTWADVLALVDVGIEVDYALTAFETGGVALGEVWVDAYGKIGSEASTIVVRQSIGSIRRVQAIAGN